MQDEQPAHGEQPARITHGAVVRLALPITLGSLSTPLLALTDTTVIGRLGDPALLGGIAVAAMVFNVVFWMLGFLRTGTAGLVAQATGRGVAGDARAVVSRALAVALALGFGVIALQGPIGWVAFRALGGTADVTAAARQFYAIRVWSAPFALVNYVVLGAVIGRGHAGIGLLLQLVINGGNIVLNVLFVTLLGMGIRGSALGTVLAESLGAGIGLLVLARLFGGFDRRALRDRGAFARVLGVNRDLMIRSASLTFVFAFFTAQGARGGDVVLAANALLMNLYLTMSYFLDGFSTAAGQLCGQSVGAGDVRGFRRAVGLTSRWCLGFAAAAALLAYTAGGSFIDLTTTSPAVRTAARVFLPFAAASPLCGAMAFEFDGVFLGATWTQAMRDLMLVALSIYLALFALLRPLGNAGLWLAMLGFLLARGALQAWRYRGLVARTFTPVQRTERSRWLAK